ncbi:hypothetical protein JOM56_012287 [Amanita muscaria]
MWETLPLEIIFEIFGIFLPGLKISTTEHDQFPWYLGQVCMTWRNAFLTFPQLWSTLDINLEWHLDHTTLERRLAMVEECLLRSGNHTISFRFTVWLSLQCPCLSPSPSPEALCCGQILDRLVEQSTRWRDAYFTLHICKAETLYSVKNRLPMLRSIQCRFMRYGTQVDMQDLNDMLVDAPRLTRISLDESIKWNIDWSSMTVIHFLVLPEVTYLLSCLKQARHLEELAIHGPLPYDTISPSTIRPITLPSLKVLEVGSLGLLLLFETPALEELDTVNAVMDGYEGIASSYIGSLRHLRKLSIFPLNVMELEQLIQCLPAAQDLYLQYSDLDMLKLPPSCGKACEVRTLTFASWRLRQHTGKEDLSRIITGWKKTRHGFGPFNNLTKISIVILKESAKAAIVAPSQDVLDSLRHHFEDQGMLQYSIQQRLVFDAGIYVPPFNTL